jgi:hypothetical protein
VKVLYGHQGNVFFLRIYEEKLYSCEQFVIAIIDEFLAGLDKSIRIWDLKVECI